ncbi:MAG: YdeI/OmpD-associated family protein [Ferruginibacter sp.]|nr:YdeI/OmpD-associated family protein [Ferruginibacter sp.]
MGKKDKAIDVYIAHAAAFAQPILTHIRELVHRACPQVEEKIKWSFPHFDYKNEMMCSMAGFKQHCAMGFWKGSIMTDPVLGENARSEGAMGHMGKIRSLKYLPGDKKLMAYIREAMELNDKGIKLPARSKATEKKELIVPQYFLDALATNTGAKKIFEQYAYSHKKEYLEWITDAKTEATRIKRISTALEWMAEGKSRHWKYK